MKNNKTKNYSTLLYKVRVIFFYLAVINSFSFFIFSFPELFLKIKLNIFRTNGCTKNNCEKNANGKLVHTNLNQLANSVMILNPLK